MMSNIRNFVIIAHIDSGKSTVADRFLELTGTVAAREMQPQYLDQMELERERGITIKMAPVRMRYHAEIQNSSEYILNLIDTPGHSDFGYEVSRALAAVEGAILLVDATKGIQAQTLANLRAARRSNLTIIGAVNKIDVASAPVEEAVASVAEILGVSKEEVMKISAKTGAGVSELLSKVVERVSPPRGHALSGGGAAAHEAHAQVTQALIFDSLYDDHKGIMAFVRIFGGRVRAGDEVFFAAAGGKARIKEVGYFTPKFFPCEALEEGEIGYVATGIKEPARVRIGDTIVADVKARTARRARDGGDSEFAVGEARAYALPGYKDPQPVVFLSFYPDGETKFEDLERALSRLKLTDPALSFEPDSNEALGRGFKVGFLGQLHFEIASSRLEREFHLSFIASFPSVAYKVLCRESAVRVITQPQDFPLKPSKVWEPVVELEIVMPPTYVNQVLALQHSFDLSVEEIRNFGAHLALRARMPLRELLRDFDDRLKSASAGFASFSYEIAGEAEADVEKMEVLVAGEEVPALTRIVPADGLEREARRMVERLKDILPRMQFPQAIQARADGKIIARETIPAIRKELGNFGKTGGDRTRKMKLWKKQQRGKKKLLGMARVKIPPEAFRELLKK